MCEKHLLLVSIMSTHKLRQLQERLAGEAGDAVSLPHGWITLKNRDTLVAEEEASDFNTTAQQEVSWFRSNFPQSLAQCGIESLLKKVGEVLSTHINDTWVPQAEKHLQIVASEVAEKLRDLGTAPRLLTLGAVVGEVANIYVTSQKNFPHMLEMFISTEIMKNRHLLMNLEQNWFS